MPSDFVRVAIHRLGDGQDTRTRTRGLARDGVNKQRGGEVDEKNEKNCGTVNSSTQLS